MKKKLLLVFLVIVCVLCCAIALVACDNDNQKGDKVSCTLERTPEHVLSVNLCSGNSIVANLGEHDVWSESNKIEKGTEYEIQVQMVYGYEIGSIKMSINGTEKPLTLFTKPGYKWYYCKYTPTGDFTITLSGAAAVEVDIVEIHPDEIELTVGDIANEGKIIAVSARSANGTPINDAAVSAVSDKTNIATVEPFYGESGHEEGSLFLVKAVSVGEATITATVGGKTAKCYVSVVPPRDVDSLTLDKTALTMEVGEKYQLNSVVAPEDVRAYYSSDNNSVVTVHSLYGSITAVSAGTATITVTAGNKTATCVVTVMAAPTQVEGSEGLRYTQNNDGTYSLTGIGSCTDTDIVVANYYEGKRVTGIGYAALKNCSEITSITISDGISQIGMGAFSGCANLTTLKLGNRVMTVHLGAFEGCYSLSKVYIDSLEHWCATNGLYLPYNDIELYVDGQKIEGELTIPDGVTSICATAFRGCADITSVIIPDSVVSIGNCAFEHCFSLESIVIPNSVTSIGGSAFKYCISLESIVIPDSVKSIGDFAFEQCERLSSVTLGSGLTSLGAYAFTNCYYLVSLTIPANVTDINNETFNHSFIHSITVDANNAVYASQSGMLYNKVECELIYVPLFIQGDVVIPNGITVIGDYAFANRSDITSVTIPDSVTSIGEGAFRECGQLAVIQLGSGLTSIADDALNDCNSLIEIVYPEELDISNLQLEGCSQFKGTHVGSLYVFGTTLMSVDDDVVTVIIPSNFTAIRANAFLSAFSLKYVYVPSTVKADQNAFNGCDNVTVIFESNSQYCSTVKQIYTNGGKCTPEGWLYELNDNNSYNKEVANISGYIGVGGEVTVPAQIDGKQVAAVTAYIGIGKVFLEREDITKITFASSMSVLGNVFDNLINLTEIALADGANEVIFIVRNLSTCTKLTGISLAGGYENYKIKIEMRGSTGTVTETQYVDVSNAAEVLATVKSVNTDQSTMGSCTIYKKA